MKNATAQDTTPPDTICRQPDRGERLSLEYLLRHVPTSAGRILDCTGERGPRGQLLKAHGARNVLGLVDGTAGEARGDEGYDLLLQGPLDFIELPEDAIGFDCVICTAALERLRNPEAFLRGLLARLAPGGLFLATVPNMQYHKIVCALTEGRWVYGDHGVWDRNNLRFYTAREIRWLLQETGIEMCKVASHVRDDEDAFPRDAEGYARSGRLRVGPLEDDVYQAWLTEYYLVLAVKPADNP